ncbi:unnamed protein product [Rhizophagus irregularis]|nr:unnamed protein product [Rhizophagus irregularis]
MSEIIEEAINSEDKKVDFSDDEILMDHRIEDLFYGHHPGLSLGRATSIFRSRAKIPPPNRNLINDLMEGMKLLGNNTKRTIIKDEKKIGALGERENLKRVSKLKSLLFFSTLVYKRESKITYKIQGCVRKLKSKLKYDDIGDQKVYKRVYKKLCDCEKKENERDNNNDNNNNNNNNDNYNDDNIYTFEDIEHKIRDMIGKDEKKIKEQIKEFDLNFTSISELNTDDGGSFCGMFWSDKENFIIIAFKGTTPTNFAEWLGNLTFQCVDARNYLFGQVHRGFYNYLFPLDEESAGKNYPCQKIIESINCKATTLKNMNGRKVNLWITGHSLGGALATLFYARLLNINYTHESWELQGAITFASPAVGDINFSTQLAALINDPRNLAKPLWRIVLNDDIVPKMPYRACNKRMRKYGYHYNVLMNYAQVGDKVTFYGNDHDPTSIKEFFSNESDKDDNIGEHVNRLKSYCKNYCKKRRVNL